MREERGGPARQRLRGLVSGERPPLVQPPVVSGGWLPAAPVTDPFAGAHDLDDGDLDHGGSDDREAGHGEAGHGEAGHGALRRGPAGWLPGSGRSVRPAAAAAAVVLALAVVGFAWARASSAPGAEVDLPARPRAPARAAAPGSPASTPGPLPTPVSASDGALAAPAPPTSPAQLVVDVEGRVRRPGLVRLAPGARVADAVRAAGGTTPGAAVDRVNLARPLADGEQVVVPGPGDPAAPAAGAGTPGGGGVAGEPPAAPVDLNTATAAALDALPGVGPVLAGRIVAWRTAHGRFSTVDELGEVPGIGPKALERLRPLVRL